MTNDKPAAPAPAVDVIMALVRDYGGARSVCAKTTVADFKAVRAAVEQVVRERDDLAEEANENQQAAMQNYLRAERAERENAELRKEKERTEAAFLKVRKALTGDIHSTDDLIEKAAELRKDAERYRFVRENPAMLLHLKNSEFDAAIDAALREGK